MFGLFLCALLVGLACFLVFNSARRAGRGPWVVPGGSSSFVGTFSSTLNLDQVTTKLEVVEEGGAEVRSRIAVEAMKLGKQLRRARAAVESHAEGTGPRSAHSHVVGPFEVPLPVVVTKPDGKVSQGVSTIRGLGVSERDDLMRRGGVFWYTAAALILTVFLYIGYVFLDAGTRGQFTWPLRVVSLLALVVVLAALAGWSVNL